MRVHVYESYVAATLLQRFMLNCQKFIDDIEQYLETTLIQSKGPHWVDNFVLPKLLIHQLEDAEREVEVHLKQLMKEPNVEVVLLHGHVQDVRHITQHTMEIYAHAEDNGDRLCCHQDGYWKVLSSEKFVDYNCLMAVKISLRVLKGVALSVDMVKGCINAFPFTCTVDGVTSSLQLLDVQNVRKIRNSV